MKDQKFDVALFAGLLSAFIVLVVTLLLVLVN